VGMVVVCKRRHCNANSRDCSGYALRRLAPTIISASALHHAHKIFIISLYTSKFLHHTFVCEVEETKMMQWFLRS
jgi:hypothetical protein